jgi:hypothetical protein
MRDHRPVGQQCARRLSEGVLIVGTCQAWRQDHMRRGGIRVFQVMAVVVTSVVVATLVGSALLAIRGFRLWGWKWRDRPIWSTWGHVATTLLAGAALITFLRFHTLGSFLLAVLCSIVLVRLAYPIAVRQDRAYESKDQTSRRV